MKRRHLSMDDVEHIALLAHIELTDKEKEQFTSQFNNILDYFEIVGNVNTENVPPTYHVLDLTNVYREDETAPSLSPEEALQNAPQTEKKFLKAPRII